MAKNKRKHSAPVIVSSKVSNQSSSPDAFSRWLLTICSVFAFALYANTLGNQFTVDDDLVISKNDFTKEGISALPKIFSSSYRAGFYDRKEGLYRPLSVALFAVEWQVAPDNPFVFHLVNVLLYAITAAVLFLFLRAMLEGKNLIIPFLITLLFIAHPVHTEVVVNVKSGDEVLAFLFSILSLWSTLRFVKSNRISAIIFANIFFLLAVLSKETAIAMAVISPLVLYFFSNLQKKQWIIVSVFLAVVLAIYFVIRVSVLKGVSDFSSIELINNSLVGAGDDWLKREATAIFMVGKYILLLFVPVTLCYDYSYNSIPLKSFSDAGALLSLLVIIALAIIAIRGVRKKDPVSFGILFFGITMAIVSNLFILIESTFAERFLYMPSLGFCVAIVFLVSKIFKVKETSVAYSGLYDIIRKNRGLSFLFSVVLVLFSVKTFSRNLDWKSNFTLLQRDVRTNPNSARIQYSLGSTYVFELMEKEKDLQRKRQLLQEGVKHLQRGTQLLPFYGDAWFNMGFAYNQLEDYPNAATCFVKGFEYTKKPTQEQYIGAGIAYGKNGDYKKALPMFRTVLAKNDTSFDAYNNLGMFQSTAGQYDSAIINLKKAIEVKPGGSEAYYNMGNVYAYRQNFSPAIDWYKQALQRDPDYILALGNMANCYAALKECDTALKVYQKILDLDPGNEQARTNMGITYSILGDSAKARAFLPKR